MGFGNFAAITGLAATFLATGGMAGAVGRAGVALRHLDDPSPTAAKDDIVLTDHDDSFNGDSREEKFSYHYKNIGGKTIKVSITVKAQHHAYYQIKPPPQPFRTETFDFKLAAGEEHEVSGTWKIDKPASEGDPEMEYGDDDHPELIGAAYSEGN